jgi:hypothetical protein
MRYLLFIFCFFNFATILLAQKPYIKISSDFDEVEVGETVIITVKSTVSGTLDITFPDEFVSGSGEQNGMQQEMDYNTGKVSTVYFFAQNGAFSKVGNYTLRALITSKNKVYRSKPITIKVVKQVTHGGGVSQRDLKQPVFGVVEKSKTKVYEGEPVLINGKIYTKSKVNVQGYHPFEVAGNAEVIELSNSTDLVFSPEVLKGQKFASAEFEKKVLFFTSPGKYKISPFEMAVLYEVDDIYAESTAFVSNGGAIEVIPLPANAPANFIGAVGKYTFERTFDKTQVKQGEVITMTVTISGYGNLHNINTPTFNLPKGIVVYGDPEIEEKVTFGLRGAEGQMIYKFNLQVVQDGDFELEPMSLCYFDPNLKKYVSLSEEKVTVYGEKSNAFKASMPAKQVSKNAEIEQLRPVLTNASSKSKSKPFIESVLFWPSLVSPIAIAFLGGLFFTRRKKIVKVITQSSITKERQKKVQDWIHQAATKASENEIKSAFSSIEKAVKLAICIKLQRAENELTMLEISSELAQHPMGEQVVKLYQQIILNCEEARYAFLEDTEKFNHTFEEAKTFIQTIF